MNTLSRAACAVVAIGLLAGAAAPTGVSAAATSAAAPQPAAVGSAAAGNQPGEGGAVTAVGRLVWESTDGSVGRCSGAAVEAENGSVVATAAHCLRDPTDPDGGAERAAEAWFIPEGGGDSGASDGSDEPEERAEYRTDGWPVTGFQLPEGWEPDRDLHRILPHDYAFVTVGKRGGKTLQQVHGAHQLGWTPVAEDRGVTALGYPAAPPHDGRTVHTCTGPSRVLKPAEAADANVGGLLLADCDLAQGASGGPWLQGYDPERGFGTLVAVTSVGNDEGGIVGRPFPDEARSLHAAAARS